MRGHMERLLQRLRRLAERLWVRIAAIAALALVAVGLAGIAAPLVPDGVSGFVTARAADDILDIIASSMLSVTIFSLSVMVTIHRAVSGQWTPRAHRLLVSDRVTMTLLATFMGAWLFALTAIILRSVAFIGEDEIIVLFGMTMIVVALIVVAIVRWIAHLRDLGSLNQTGDRIEWEATQALDGRMERPCLGGRPLVGDGSTVPADPVPVRADRTGWVSYIYGEELSGLAEERETEIWIVSVTGRFVHRGDVLARVGRGGEEIERRLREGIEVAKVRTFDQDPRFGLVVLGEVASKALSPGINDAGTAIDAVGRIARVLDRWRSERAEGEPERPRLHVPPLRASDLMEDAFAPIARDGAGVVEVQIHLQQTLAALARHAEPSMAAAARAMAEEARDRAMDALSGWDVERFERALPPLLRRAA